jgi:formylglycine-generating enzyme required for sulfatase activity
VKGFWIGKYEITQGQWKNIMGYNPASFKLGYNYPVENVSWDEVQEFIRKLNKINEKTGKKYRLPTETEWEFACRSREKNDKYSGTTESDMDAFVWYESNSEKTTHPVGTTLPNALGIYDMSGNVWEWCEDIYISDAYDKSQPHVVTEEDKETDRVIRGGSWQYPPRNCRCTFRRGKQTSLTGNDIGFRLVMESKE